MSCTKVIHWGLMESRQQGLSNSLHLVWWVHRILWVRIKDTGYRLELRTRDSSNRILIILRHIISKLDKIHSQDYHLGLRLETLKGILRWRISWKWRETESNLPTLNSYYQDISSVAPQTLIKMLTMISVAQCLVVSSPPRKQWISSIQAVLIVSLSKLNN
jgi:hypothetical protein